VGSGGLAGSDVYWGLYANGYIDHTFWELANGWVVCRIVLEGTCVPGWGRWSHLAACRCVQYEPWSAGCAQPGMEARRTRRIADVLLPRASPTLPSGSKPGSRKLPSYKAHQRRLWCPIKCWLPPRVVSGKHWTLGAVVLQRGCSRKGMDL
jgi:hypothetical protein